MLRTVTVLDYGMGNIQSISNAFRALGATPRIVDRGENLGAAEALVLPGVGAFPDGIQALRDREIVDPLEAQVLEKGVPFLGVCLGLQLLADRGTEHGIEDGLGWLSGTVERLDPTDGYRVPHMGWNDLEVAGTDGLFADLPPSPTMYFVHSYHFVPTDGDDDTVTATTDHGQTVTAGVRSNNVYGVQFHPEKSQAAGLKLLENFLEIADDSAGN